MYLNLTEKKSNKLTNSPILAKSVLNTRFINLCFSASNDYVQHLCTTLKSIFSNKEQNEEFNIIILEYNIKDKNKKYIESIVSSNSTIRFIKVNEEIIRENCILRTDVAHINSLATYYRFLLSDFITEDKILYLDCDVIVNKSLWNLYNTDIDNYYIAGVRDSYEKENRERLGVDKYINAGVMLINLKLWKENNIKDKLLNWCSQNQGKILWLDQDVLNVVLQDKIKYLDNIYNAQVSEMGFGMTKEFNKIAGKSVIIHYVGHKKPWMNNRFILSNYYYKYLLKTKFRYKYFILILSEVFSIKEELSGTKKYIVLRILGLQIKFRKEQ